MHEIRMASQAGVLSHPAVSRLDPNRLVEVFQRKGQRVEKTIVGLRDPLAHEMVGQVAIIADGDVPMAGILPRIVVVLHDVAIGARQRIVAQVTRTLTVAEREHADAPKDSQHDHKDGREQPRPDD